MEDRTFMHDKNLLIRGGTRKADLVDINSKSDFPTLGADFGGPPVKGNKPANNK